jgi:predicted amidohydrolase
MERRRSMKFATLILACSVLSGQEIYDLLLKNGRVIDPANHRDGHFDVAEVGKSIVRVAPDLPASHARVVVDASSYIITPGLIDINTHLGPPLKPDHNTLPYGVTTVVDAGTATCETFPNFKKEAIDHAKVRVLAFVSGDAECASRVGRQYQEAVVGRAADTSASEFHATFIPHKLLPDTISSGMDWNNILIPRTNMATTMSIYLTMGMTVEQIIERATSNAARAIKRPQLGTLSEGSQADIAVLEIQQGKFGLLDSDRTRLDATRRFRCLLTVRNGVIVWDSDGLSIPDTTKAGPYTNFK